MKKSIVLIVFLTGLNLSNAQIAESFLNKADAFFKSYVENGKVKYSEIKANQADLSELKTMLANSTVSKDNTLEYQAFWINAYNLSVIDGVVANYPIKSPLDVAGFFDKKTHEVGGKKITLNDIENKMLRAVFPKEARFHFVLVCAGLGCPPIINEAYLPSKLDKQLKTQTMIALNNPNFIIVQKNKVQISQIFEWYKSDFLHEAKSLVEFINKYKTEKIPENAKVTYYAYDWKLNDLK